MGQLDSNVQSPTVPAAGVRPAVDWAPSVASVKLSAAAAAAVVRDFLVVVRVHRGSLVLYEVVELGHLWALQEKRRLALVDSFFLDVALQVAF
jgi:hypothetical protein